MQHVAVALIMLAVIFGGALLGLWLQKVLPDQHLTTETKEVVRLAFALVATIAALVLSLLVSSASSSFGRFDDELTQNAAKIVMLDRTLAEYGPKTDAIRAALKERFAKRMELIYTPEQGASDRADAWDAITQAEKVDAMLFALVPEGPVQQGSQARAVALNSDINMTNTLIHAQRDDSMPTALLIVLGAWLTLIFAAFALFAPNNPVVIGSLLVCSMSAAGAVFLILELSSPFTGLITVSGAPMHEALLYLGR
jgi:Arc/MetJ family transcription regulator